MESVSASYFILKGEFLMVIVFAVILAVLCVAGICKTRRRVQSDVREDVPEEVLAGLMPGEYPQYKKLFEMQKASEYSLPLQH